MKRCLSYVFLSFVSLFYIQNLQSQNVDPFNGNLNYSLPVLSIPSPDGPAIPIVLRYSAGIQMEQKASWIGLGWDLDVGAISRSVKGIPDDWNNMTTFRKDFAGTILDETRYYGPIYFKEMANNIVNDWRECSMDSYLSYSREGETNFELPNYDSYRVNGAGINGVIQPFLFDRGSFYHKPIKEILSDGTVAEETTTGFTRGESFVNDVQFRFINEHTTIKTPTYFDDLDVLSRTINMHAYFDPMLNGWVENPPNHGYLTTYQTNPDPGTSDPGIEYQIDANGFIILGSGFSSSNTQSFLYDVQTTEVYSGDLENNKAKSRKNIKTYKNSDLISSPSGFIGCYEITNRNFTFPNIDGGNNLNGADDIGAFSITNESGYTYHYSLPVYRNYEENYTIDTDHTYTVNGNSIGKKSTKNKYVSKWLLTAITGPDYIDVNNNHLVDANDNGYWVMYRYGKWASDFVWQSPFFGGSERYNIKANYENSYRNNKDYVDLGYEESVGISKGSDEIYYIDYIQTSTHTAVFVKDIRIDEHTKSGTPIPLLKLEKIVLLKNENLGLLTNSAEGNLSSESSFTDLTANKNNVIDVGNYNSNNTAIEQNALSIVELTQDYSLCPNYNNNRKITVDANSPEGDNLTYTSTTIGDLVYEDYTQPTFVNLTTGKLSLKEIQIYGYEKEDKVPEYKFTYDANYNYNPTKVDLWGYYKSDGGGTDDMQKLTSPISKDFVDAWSLTRIQTPTQGEINIEYESDEYEKVSENQPMRVFALDNVFNPQDNSMNLSATNSHIGFKATPETKFFDFIKELVDDNRLSEIEDIIFTLPLREAANSGLNRPIKTFNASWKSQSNVTSLVNNINSSINFINNTVNRAFNTGTTYNIDEFPISVTLVNVPTNYIGSVRVIMKSAYGGGIRVKSLSNVNGDGTVYKNNYTYENGVASVEPFITSLPTYKSIRRNWDLFDPSQFSPNVGYSKVTISGEGTNLQNSYTQNAPTYSTMEYFNYDECSPIDVERKFAQLIDNNYNTQSQIRRIDQREIVFINDKRQINIGKLKNQSTYDYQNNMLSKVVNVYDDGGSTSEYFTRGIRTLLDLYYLRYPFGESNPFWYNSYLYLNSAYIRTIETQILKKQIVYGDGIKSEIEFTEFDPITKQPLVTITKDPSTGANIRKEKVMAYTLPAYEDMGVQSIDDTKENLLGVVAEERVYEDNKLMSGYYKTFRENIPVRQFSNGSFITQNENKFWTTHKLFEFTGNDDINTWREQLEVTLYNEKGDILEQKGFNDRYAASKMGYDNLYQLSSIGNAKYEEFTYTGAEDLNSSTGFFGGEVHKYEGTIVSDVTQVHSGRKALKVTPGKKGFKYDVDVTKLTPGRTYKASVWVYKPNINDATIKISGIVNGKYLMVTSSNNILSVDNHHLLSVEFTLQENATSGSISIWCDNTVSSTNAYFDDFKFHPIDQPIQGYNYDMTKGQVTSILNEENLYTRFEYDLMGRVYKTYIETKDGEKLISESTYNYQRN